MEKLSIKYLTNTILFHDVWACAGRADGEGGAV